MVRGTVTTPLEAVPSAGEGGFDEKFLQQLLYDHPECLPLRDIEPGLEPFRSVRKEMPTPSGFIDNLLLNASGDVAIVEAKLWSNPEARRKVVAQALDYATCLFKMSYETFQECALRGEFSPGWPLRPCMRSSRSRVTGPSRNSSTPSPTISAEGESSSWWWVVGIRKETERLVEGLQSHAGFHFTFALVELGVYRVPGGDGLLVVPNALAQTQLIDRGVVRLEASGVRVDPPTSTPSRGPGGRQHLRRKTSSTRCRSGIRIFRLA